MDKISCKSAKEKGLPRYFTGKPCKYGHIAERRVIDRGCVVCSSENTARHRGRNPNSMREVAKRYRQKHPERVKAAKERYNAENKESIAEYYKRRYAENPEAMRAASRKYREENPERVKDAQKAYQEKHSNRLSARRRAYYNANIEREREKARTRARATYEARRDYMVAYMRAYYAANKDDFSERARAWREANPEKCKQYHVNRKAKLKKAEGSFDAGDIGRMMESQNCMCSACGADLDDTGFHVDHVVPLAKGGSNWPSNLQLLCPPCNLGKGTKSNEEWLATLTG